MPDPRYQELNTKLNEIIDQISQSLPSGKERLLLELDEVWVEREEYCEIFNMAWYESQS